MLYLLASTSLLASDLQSLWAQAIQSSTENSTQEWQVWIQEAKMREIVAPEAYFNLAHAHWSKNEISPAILNLLISAQLRVNPLGILSDLNLIGKIQRALLDAPSPIESPQLRTFFVWKDEIKFLGKTSLAWLLFLILFFHFAFLPPKRVGLALSGFALLIGVTGIFIDLTQKEIGLPVILTNQGGLVPVYRTTDNTDEKPIMELPSGLLVMPESEKDAWIQIAKPTPGWIKKEMQLPFPLVTSNSSNKNEAYQSKGLDPLARFSRFHSDYLKQSERL